MNAEEEELDRKVRMDIEEEEDQQIRMDIIKEKEEQERLVLDNSQYPEEREGCDTSPFARLYCITIQDEEENRKLGEEWISRIEKEEQRRYTLADPEGVLDHIAPPMMLRHSYEDISKLDGLQRGRVWATLSRLSQVLVAAQSKDLTKDKLALAEVYLRIDPHFGPTVYGTTPFGKWLSKQFRDPSSPFFLDLPY